MAFRNGHCVLRGVRRRLESRVEEIRNYIRRMHRVIEYGNLIDLSPIQYYFIACIFAGVRVCAYNNNYTIKRNDGSLLRCFAGPEICHLYTTSSETVRNRLLIHRSLSDQIMLVVCN